MKLYILSSLRSGPRMDKGTLSKKKEGPLWVWPPALRRPRATGTTNTRAAMFVTLTARDRLGGGLGFRNPRLGLLKLLHPRLVLIILTGAVTSGSHICLLVCTEFTVLVGPFHPTEQTPCPLSLRQAAFLGSSHTLLCHHATIRTQGELGHLLHFWLCEFGHGYSTSLVFHSLSGKLLKQEHTLHWMPEAGSEKTQVRVVDSNLHCPSFLSDGHSGFPPISPSLSNREYSASVKQAR